MTEQKIVGKHGTIQDYALIGARAHYVTELYQSKEVVIEQNKPWQHGYTLNYLKSLETAYEPYNKFTYSPFTKYKKNDIAQDLHEGNLHLTSTTSWVEHVAKVKSPITCYHDVEIAWKQPGDVVITKVCGSSEALESRLDTLLHRSVWVQHWVEDHSYDDFLKRKGFIFVGGKVVTSSEIYGIWFRGYDKCNVLFGTIDVENRKFPKLDPIEFVTLKKVRDVDVALIKQLNNQLTFYDLHFAKSDLTAYVNKDWSALSLRGYRPEPEFIADPNEMSKAWNEKHKGEHFELQDTPLFDKFIEVRCLIDSIFPNVELHRVTLMKMKPNGVLQRHTDQIDWNHGLATGKLVRFHFPIKTNENVKFLAWEMNGNLLQYNMKVGEMWLLDTRKPHKVIVEDDNERIHLTIDVKIDSEVRKMILNG